ncbi:MAG: serine/threonine-protein kinase [Candidatus Sericytochromatia bacterium]
MEDTSSLDKFKIKDTYETEEVVGHGSTGIVYSGKELKTGNPVAIKILNQELSKHDKFVNQLKIEIDKISNLSHPNIVSVKDTGKEGEKCFIILEYVKCKSLADFLKANKNLSVKEATSLLKQLALAVQYTSDNKIVHKSITPTNILVSSDNVLKLSGFGINSALATAWLTMTGTSNAHVEYMSPEQAEGEEADYRSDIYSLGIIAYLILTGEVPFKRDSTSKSILAVAMKHINTPPEPPTEKNPEIPKWLEDIVLKCLEKKAEDRFQSGKEIYDYLEAQKSPYEANSNNFSSTSTSDDDYVTELPQDIKPTEQFFPPEIKQVTVTPEEVKERKTGDKLKIANNRNSNQVVSAKTGPLPTSPKIDSENSPVIHEQESKKGGMNIAVIAIMAIIIIALLLVIVLKK